MSLTPYSQNKENVAEGLTLHSWHILNGLY